MLATLTRYLFLYRQVTIPHVGTVYLATETADLKFIEKLLAPPREKFRLRSDDAVQPHQLDYLMAAENADAQSLQAKLDAVGLAIKKEMEDGSFNWRGVGRFSGSVFIGADDNLLQPVPAQKVHRADALHQVLVGDRHVASRPQPATEMPEELEETAPRSKAWIAWAILVLGLVIAVYMLASGKFQPESFGLRLTP